ncbi:MAG: prepilin-type N-terminal cleavage/methylation domain-containing protein [Kiritimatiellae bacterium]|nr:prepilin-type N-terminal cleavage/methylation domain-containing protein [Kiritimatiellia bacterium]
MNTPCTQPGLARKRRRPARGFTLVELLVVIAVIVILAGIMFPAVRHVRERARQTTCINGLHQFSVAWLVYRSDHDNKGPDWLSCLYPEYIDTADIYLCPSDKSEGADGSKPPHPAVGEQFAETDDNDSHPPPYYGRNGDIHGCSYLYEFCAAPCTWGIDWLSYSTHAVTEEDLDIAPKDGRVSWGEVKEHQLTWGDKTHAGAYSAAIFPVIRCFHHHEEQSIQVNDPAEGPQTQGLTFNVSYIGNVFRAPLAWELTMQSDLWK